MQTTRFSLLLLTLLVSPLAAGQPNVPPLVSPTLPPSLTPTLPVIATPVPVIPIVPVVPRSR